MRTASVLLVGFVVLLVSACNHQVSYTPREKSSETYSFESSPEKPKKIESTGASIVTYQKIGDTYYGNDGSTARKSGETYYFSNGTTAVRTVDTFNYSDGSTGTKIGNTIYNHK